MHVRLVLLREDCRRLFWGLKAGGKIAVALLQRWSFALVQLETVRGCPLVVTAPGSVRQRLGVL